MSFSRSIIIGMCLTPLGVLVLMEACSPMKSGITGAVKQNSRVASTAGVCSSAFAPASISTLQAKAAAADEPQGPFSQQKVHLSNASFSKAVANLSHQTVVVVINMKCQIRDNQSLSSKVLSQHPELKTALSRKALEYTIQENLSLTDLIASAESDPCVAGVVPPTTLTLSSLALPTSSDPDLRFQEHLMPVNYLHAYQHLALKQNASDPKATVALIDTGISCNHADLSSNLVSYCGYNMIDSASTPEDNDGHGSVVAGLIGAVSGNSQGILGLAGNSVELMSIKVIDQSSGSVVVVTDGIQQAIDNQVDVINISLEAAQKVASIENALAEAVQAGIVVVMAAGNGRGNLMSSTAMQISPAGMGKNLKGAITVGSVDTVSSQLSDFSNYGPYVEITAPGAIDSSLPSTQGGLYSTYKNGNFFRMMGTSQAAPIVSGAAALLIQFFKAHNVTYTPAHIENIILASADSISSLNVAGGRLINFSKLTRNAYAFAGVDLCE